MRDRRFEGPGGDCICLGCGTRIGHQRGAPCLQQRCPRCGKAMVREGGAHHLAYLEKEQRAGKTP